MKVWGNLLKYNLKLPSTIFVKLKNLKYLSNYMTKELKFFPFQKF